MARMIPDHLREDTKSNAEKALYRAFEQQLPDSMVVFHQVPWQLINPRDGARDGEADFVVVDPDRGMLIIEVKGGAVRYEGREAQWYSGIHRIKDPFAQGQGSKYSLLAFLKEQSFWKHRYVTMGHAVAFPDAVVTQHWLRPDAPRAIVLDKTQMGHVDEWIHELFDHYAGQGHRGDPIGAVGVEHLIRLFSPSLTIKPLLGLTIEDEAEEMLKLSEAQYKVLDLLRRQRQAAIAGCAGSGKTVLAIEKARRLSQQGFQVLVTCFNRNLAAFLRASLTDDRGIHVAHFHGLCSEFAREAGILPRVRPHNDEYFNETLPSLLMEAADTLNRHFDAIIVDEGQDFRDEWWIALRCLLPDPDNGILYVFYDDNQNLYHTNVDIPLDVAPFDLTENLRNTQAIHAYVRLFYRADHEISAAGPTGRAIEKAEYSTVQDLKRLLRQTIHRLTREEQIPVESIVILTPYAPHRSALQQISSLGDYALTQEPSGNGEVYWTNIYQYKGLESPVVILVEIDEKFDDLPLKQSIAEDASLYTTAAKLTPENLLYVGASRASHHLIIFRHT